LKFIVTLLFITSFSSPTPYSLKRQEIEATLCKAIEHPITLKQLHESITRH
jgi:hypothetical protein